MRSFNITLPDAIANALNAYIRDQEVTLPANAIFSFPGSAWEREDEKEKSA